MKGDFSRIRFNPAKRYTSVLKQQGRVDLDSDANEQCFIDENLRDTINLDVIGRYGCPENSPGFEILVAGSGEIYIGPGRYYVDGIMVENPRWRTLEDQLYLVNPGFSSSDLIGQLIESGQTASISVWLEVWQRLITALDDPCLLEPALGQADTTARLQTVWRVVAAFNSGSSPSPTPVPVQTSSTSTFAKQSAPGNKVAAAKKSAIKGQTSKVAFPTPQQGLKSVDTNAQTAFRIGDQPIAFDPITSLSPCCQSLYGGDGLERTGSMEVTLAQGGNDCGCQPIAAAGFQGLENQLYRVEIQQGGDLTSATFKWSRENASVVTAVTQVGANSPIITVAGLGPDANLGFQPGQWVELTDDSYQFGGAPNQSGPLFKILFVHQETLQVTMTTPVFGIDTNLNARMRRWDQAGDSLTSAGIPVSSTPVPLENGIQVDFRDGKYQPGDYWTVPARTASGQIDWPPCGGDGNQYQPATWTKVHRAPLACISLNTETALATAKKTGSNVIADGRFLISDCRLFFPPLTSVTTQSAPQALHVTAVSWNNDDIMTADALLTAGFSVTFDQPTTCPWGGGNFQVSIEAPLNPPGAEFAILEGKLPGFTVPTFSSPPGTDCFLRSVVALDPPFGIEVSGNQVTWITSAPGPGGQIDYGAYWILAYLNNLLSWTSPIGYGRMRVRLIGGAVYGSDANGNKIYLDGQSLGSTGTRLLDGSECVSLNTPSGDSFALSDYESWFYLAPTVYITNVVIQGINSNGTVGVPNLTTVTVVVNNQNQITGFAVPGFDDIASIQAVITLSYPPVSPVTVNLTLLGPGAGTIVTVSSSVQVPAGQVTFNVPINVIANPGLNASGQAVSDTVTLVAAVPIFETALTFSPGPTLTINGVAPPTVPIIFRPSGPVMPTAKVAGDIAEQLKKVE
ncbi:MAG TPA: DUF6519 domain-containing protein [Terracidiphilus sp.]|nr:DUF6519 domain-containing protein [Terracidiphilus sp.]